MSRAGIETLLYMMDMAFEGRTNEVWGNWHALLENLSSVRDEDWTWLPEGGHRTILHLVSDLGMCKYAYASAAFGDGSMNWDKQGTIPELEDGSPPAVAIQYLRTAQGYWRAKVAELDDDSELMKTRTGPWTSPASATSTSTSRSRPPGTRRRWRPTKSRCSWVSGSSARPERGSALQFVKQPLRPDRDCCCLWPCRLRRRLLP